MNKAHRIWQWLVGTVLITTGVLILYAFHFLARENQETWFDQVGTILIIEAYSIVASLFILVGLRYIFGRKWVIEGMIGITCVISPFWFFCYPSCLRH